MFASRQLLTSMAGVHLSTLRDLSSHLLLASHPLLLTLGTSSVQRMLHLCVCARSMLDGISPLPLCANVRPLSTVLRHVATQRISNTRVRAIIKCVDLDRIRQDPPTSASETDQLALSLVAAATFDVPAPSALLPSVPISPTHVEPHPASPKHVSTARPPERNAASVALAALSQHMPSESTPTPRKRKSRASSSLEKKVQTGDTLVELEEGNEETKQEHEHEGTVAVELEQEVCEEKHIPLPKRARRSSSPLAAPAHPPLATAASTPAPPVADRHRMEDISDGNSPASDASIAAALIGAAPAVTSAVTSGTTDLSHDMDIDPSPPIVAENPPASSEPASATSAVGRVSSREQRDMEDAMRQSLVEAVRAPAITPAQHKSYEAHVKQELQTADRVLRVVPGSRRWYSRAKPSASTFARSSASRPPTHRISARSWWRGFEHTRRGCMTSAVAMAHGAAI